MARRSKLTFVLLTFCLLTILVAYYVFNFIEVRYVLHINNDINMLSGDRVKPEHFLVFDAVRHEGSLQFLDDLSNKWIVLLVNPAKKSQLKTCRKCQVVHESWSHLFLNHEISSQMWRETPDYAKQKAIAILYALWNSAEWIYVTDSGVLLDEETLLSTCSRQQRTAPVYRGPSLVFEPCEHFMDPYTWHGLKNPNISQGVYSVKNIGTDAIHMVVNNCYRKHMDTASWKRGLDKQAPRPHVISGTFSSIDFSNVIVSRNMAWTLLASLTQRSYDSQSLNEQKENLILNLMIQRIVWETNGTIGFLPTSQFSDTTVCPSCDINKPLENKGQTRLNDLTKWRCKPTNNLIECIEQLSKDFHFQELSNSTNPTSELKILLAVWVNLFSSEKLPKATRVPLTAARLARKDKGIHLQFTAAKSMHVFPSSLSLPQNVFADLCKTNDGKKYTPYIPSDNLITDILLVIIFNYPNPMSHIPKIEYIYGRHFKHILYCAESAATFHKLYASKYPKNPVSFVEVPTRLGYWGQACIAAASRINYQVSGYLQISDDVILNAWNLRTLPRSIPWFQSNLRVANIDQKVVADVAGNPDGWWPWSLFCGQSKAVQVYKKLMELRATTEAREKVSAFLQNLRNVFGCDRCLIYEVSDIFYIPTSMGADFAFFSDIFAANQVFLEITIPTILIGLTTDTEIYRLRGNYLWKQNRDLYQKFYTQYDHYLHPWKFSQFPKPGRASFFCREVIDRIDEDLKLIKGNNTRQ